LSVFCNYTFFNFEIKFFSLHPNADDSVVICADKNIQNLKATSEIEFQKVENWLQLNKTTLNYKKSSCVCSLTTATKLLTTFA